MSNIRKSMEIGGGSGGSGGGGGIICGSDRAPKEIIKNLNRSAGRGSNTGLSDYKTILKTVRKSVMLA
jgi:hypothetical protein